MIRGKNRKEIEEREAGGGDVREHCHTKINRKDMEGKEGRQEKEES
jgi:hypothetical protein